MSHRQAGQTQLTKAEREGAVPRPSLPPQAGENLGTFQGVARVTVVRHRATGKVTLVLPLVAKLGDARILAFHQLKTLQKGDAAHQEKKNKQIKKKKCAGVRVCVAEVTTEVRELNT